MDNKWTGWKNFSSFDVSQSSRSDVVASSTIKRKSGGVATLVQKSLSAFSDKSMTSEHLEMVSVKDGSNDNDPNRMTLIYKDHQMPKKEFLQMMQQVFHNHQPSKSFIMGDFNINMREDHSLETIARTKGFIPLVDCATTIHDTLLDQVFINFPAPKNSHIVVLQSYFSDHDLVVLCMKKDSN